MPRSSRLYDHAHSLRMCLALSAVLVLAAASVADEAVRITVLPGEKQEFKGLGCNGRDFDKWVPDASRDTLIHLIWKDMNFRVFRFAKNFMTKWTDEYMVRYYRDAVTRVRKYVPDIIWLFNPTGVMTDPYTWGQRIAEAIEALEKGYNITIEYTGIGNEPNQQYHKAWGSAAPMSSASIPAVIKATRVALDARGLTHVKIIAPGSSNVDQYFIEVVEGVMSDNEALEALYAWEYHSYNMSITQGMYNWIGPTGKEIWQTESSLPEGDDRFDDSMSAAQSCTRFLADMNFGVNYWMYWNDAWVHPKPGDNGVKFIAYDEYTGELKALCKLYYFRQLSRTLVPGTRMRKCTTDVHVRMAEEGMEARDADKYMEYWYGLKIPLAATAGIRPDGSWVMAAINHTGLRFTDYGSLYYPKADYDVTFYIEELADSGEIEFLVWRCNNGTRNVFDAQPAVMRNGEVTVALRHCDLICLTNTSFDTTFEPVPDYLSVVEGGSCGSCGTGIVLAFVPPIGFGAATRLRRRRRRREERR